MHLWLDEWVFIYKLEPAGSAEFIYRYFRKLVKLSACPESNTKDLIWWTMISLFDQGWIPVISGSLQDPLSLNQIDMPQFVIQNMKFEFLFKRKVVSFYLFCHPKKFGKFWSSERTVLPIYKLQPSEKNSNLKLFWPRATCLLQPALTRMAKKL
jgi:hypothetical protein